MLRHRLTIHLGRMCVCACTCVWKNDEACLHSSDLYSHLTSASLSHPISLLTCATLQHKPHRSSHVFLLRGSKRSVRLCYVYLSNSFTYSLFIGYIYTLTLNIKNAVFLIQGHSHRKNNNNKTTNKKFTKYPYFILFIGLNAPSKIILPMNYRSLLIVHLF